jgi:hypothetical protein
MHTRRGFEFRRGLAAGIVALALSLAFAGPAAAVNIPSVSENGWGHLWGCLSVFFDRPVHAEFCGPSQITPDMLVEMLKHSDPPPVPSCGSCTNGAGIAWPERAGPVLIAALYALPGPLVRRDDEPILLLACCPISSS